MLKLNAYEAIANMRNLLSAIEGDLEEGRYSAHGEAQLAYAIQAFHDSTLAIAGHEVIEPDGPESIEVTRKIVPPCRFRCIRKATQRHRVRGYRLSNAWGILRMLSPKTKAALKGASCCFLPEQQTFRVVCGDRLRADNFYSQICSDLPTLRGIHSLSVDFIEIMEIDKHGQERRFVRFSVWDDRMLSLPGGR